MLVLTMHEETLYTERALRAGARGYIMKDKPGEEILLAVRRVLSGRIYLSDQMGTKLLAPLISGGADLSSSPIDRLSDRELEVFQLLGKAYETRQIAEKMQVSVKTVESYREHIKVKLNLENSTQLIHHAVVWSQSGDLA
jgi:DNA-binding NarL/FixJ family response regulator